LPSARSGVWTKTSASIGGSEAAASCWNGFDAWRYPASANAHANPNGANSIKAFLASDGFIFHQIASHDPVPKLAAGFFEMPHPS
jgi:hypothetical protein